MKLLIDSTLPATPPDEVLGPRPFAQVGQWVSQHAVTDWDRPNGWEMVNWQAVKTVERGRAHSSP